VQWGQEITCTLASGAVPGSYPFVYTATVDSDATVSVGNSVVIDEGGGDPDPACPSCDTNHPVSDAAVAVNKIADPISGTEVTAGQTISYTLSVEVSDSATTDAVVLTDTLGAGLTLDAGSLPVECGAVGQVVTCTLASGSVPGSYTFEYSATVDFDAVTAVNNNVEATGGDDPACGTCETGHPIVSPELSLAKALVNPPNPIVEGSVVTYVITATNTGGVELYDVEIVDDMITPDFIVCPNVAVAETCVLEGTYTVTADDVTAGELTNTAFANGEDSFGNPVPEVVDSVVTVIGVEEYMPIPVPVANGFGLLLLILSTLMVGVLAAGRRLQSPRNW
jgi:large repetitive protein